MQHHNFSLATFFGIPNKDLHDPNILSLLLSRKLEVEDHDPCAEKTFQQTIRLPSTPQDDDDALSPPPRDGGTVPVMETHSEAKEEMIDTESPAVGVSDGNLVIATLLTNSSTSSSSPSFESGTADDIHCLALVSPLHDKVLPFPLSPSNSLTNHKSIFDFTCAAYRASTAVRMCSLDEVDERHCKLESV